jgi:hypothetical protein
VGFLTPNQKGDEDESLPGATGLHLDLDLKRCPSCRRELTPWQERCGDCGDVGVAASAVPPDRFALPDLSHLEDDEEPDADDAPGQTDAPTDADDEGDTGVS